MNKTMRGVCVAAATLCAISGFADIRALTPAVPDAEWTKSWWPKRFAAKQELVKKGGAKYVFIGDSITQLFETGSGSRVWKKYFGGKDAPYPALNLGYSGDRTEHVLYRIAHGELDGYEAKVVVLLIGTNNTGHHTFEEEPPADTILGVRACLKAIRAKQPKAKIVLCSIFPRGANAQDPLRVRNDTVNRELYKFADGRNVFWCDVTRQMVRPSGVLPAELFPDLLHPGELGYEIWANAVIPYFNGFAASVFPNTVTDDQYSDRRLTPCDPVTRVADYWWLDRLERNRNLIAGCGGAYDIVMLGDSITHYWEIGEGLDESRDIEILEKKWKILNCGYGGDKIEHLLWRIRNGELEGYKAKLFTLMIGTNNYANKPEEIAAGVRTIISELRRKQPQAKILLVGYIPIGEKKDSRHRAQLESVKPIIRNFADGETVFYIDFADKFLKPDGTTNREMFDYEYIHPSTEGYRVWREIYEAEFPKLLK